ncbi:unnamed protein product [Fraxinus pennsylvanica]|uniref:Pentatricopeptide repeat-containing protein n=1 Tax=Fraxinus pennsylvanica TaxID=56036 RepID=A0AAD2A9Z3_9LAMI|nr:unnamed protein product [Fraxinus pennsylvanica]
MFLSVLYDCSHNGLVERGMNVFESMKNEYKVEPKLEHCACIVDLLCWAGRVEDAFDNYKRMFSNLMPVEKMLCFNGQMGWGGRNLAQNEIFWPEENSSCYVKNGTQEERHQIPEQG